MSDQWRLRLPDQAHTSTTAPVAEVVSWGSTDALDAVKRICDGVAMRCHQAIAKHHSGDAPEISGPRSELTRR